jgi:tetraacyldisaccharide 4'-kinase
VKLHQLQHKIRLFWQYRGWASFMLLPLSMVYFVAHVLNFYLLQRPKRVPAFIVCVGNAVVGGAGKTPFAIAIGKLFLHSEMKVAFVNAGYGGNYCGVQQVLEDSTAMQVGDEALLLSKVAPTFVSKNRYQACMAAHAEGAEIIILDDALQNNTVVKDYTFLLVDSESRHGNGFLMPAGPLREPFWMARNRADAVVLMVQDELASKQVAYMEKIQPDVIAVVKANTCLDKELQYHAFCSIAWPQKFLHSLLKHGYHVAQTTFFADHHLYTQEDIDCLLQSPYQLVTTAKDYVKLPQAVAQKVKVLEIGVEFFIGGEK